MFGVQVLGRECEIVIQTGSEADYAGRIEKEGAAVVAAVVDAAGIALLIGAIDALAGEQTAAQNTGIYALRNLLDSPAICDFAESPAIRRLVIPILGEGAFAVRGIFFDKTPDANWKVNWHQDLAIAVRERRDAAGFGAWSEKAGAVHVQPPPELLARMLTVRVHLDDCPPENGALRVLAGSHLTGRLRDADIARWRGQIKETVCAVNRGGVVALRPLLLHASSASELPVRRRVLHLEYAAEGLPGGLQWRHGTPARS